MALWIFTTLQIIVLPLSAKVLDTKYHNQSRLGFTTAEQLKQELKSKQGFSDKFDGLEQTVIVR